VKKGILRMLGVVVTLALMLTILPASIASAALIDTVTVTNVTGDSTTNPYYGKAQGLVGHTVNFSGSGETNAHFSIYLSNQKAEVNDDIGVDVTTFYEWEDACAVYPGVNFTRNLVIPSSLKHGTVDLAALHGGTYYFYFVKYDYSPTGPGTSTTPILKVVPFQIMGIANATIDKNNGYVGDEVIVTGSGFAPDEALIVTFANRDISGTVGNPYTENNGSFELNFVIPESIIGTQKIKITGEDSRAAFEFDFTVKPKLIVTPTSGQAGTVLTINGTGFAYRNGIVLFLNGVAVASTDFTWVTDATYKRTTNLGSFTLTMPIPSGLAAGTYTIKVEDEDSTTINASTTFEVLLNSVLAISHSTGNVGDTVTVTGTTFAANTSVNILFDTQIVGTVITDALGNFSQQITVPAAVCGAHVIKVGTIQQAYTVTPTMTMDKTQGIAGTTVTLTGKGFAGGTAIIALFNNNAITLTPAVTDATGGFTATFVVPATATGTYNVQVTAGTTVSSNFTIVDASMTLNVASGEVGDTITVSGANFAAGSNITLTIDGLAIPNMGTVTAGANGGFTAAFIIPTIAGGAHTLAVTDGTTTKTENFTVTSSATITPTLGNVGTAVTVSGEGFKAGNTLTIKYAGTVVATAILPLTGAFTNATFTVPASDGGANTVEVTDGINAIQLTFTMETTAPSAPSLTLPLSASKEKGIVTFDWNDVTDASMPVTYNLQVAGDSGFSNIVVNKTGLTASTYTLTEAEELPKLADGGQYYWRVIATDAANNSSTSAVNTFTVGGNLPGWLMWLWIGIGVVVVFIFAIWLGRRMAYSSY